MGVKYAGTMRSVTCGRVTLTFVVVSCMATTSCGQSATRRGGLTSGSTEVEAVRTVALRQTAVAVPIPSVDTSTDSTSDSPATDDSESVTIPGDSVATSQSLSTESKASTPIVPSTQTTTTGQPRVVAPVVASKPGANLNRCGQKSGMLTTPSGRRVLLRADGVAQRSPIVFILHGYTGTPTGIEKFSEFTIRANASSVAVAFPEGTAVPKGGFGWNSGAGLFATSGVDDVSALYDMVDAVVRTGCVDPNRMTLAGESNGAGMSLAAVCDERLANRFLSLVMVIPAVDDGVLGHCAAGRAPSIPLTIVAGRLDRTVPFDDGRPPLLPQLSWFAQAATTLNQCAPAAVAPVSLGAHVDIYRPAACVVCAELLAIDDGVHTWPGTSKGAGGLRPGTFDLDDPLLALALGGKPGCIA
jgi:poly(3-hydroxybutyrate) depolymerase